VKNLLLASMLKFVVLLIAIAFGGVVCFVNLDPVVVNVPFGHPMQLPLAFVMILAFFFGIITMVFQFSLDILRKTMEVRKLTKRLRTLEDEVASLRPQAPSDLQPRHRSNSVPEAR
jgi:uncharacterized integral membrane protein